MSKRNDITDGIFATTKKYGLVYTEELGWIDLGHAQGQDARILKRKLEQEHFSTYYDEFHDWYFPVDYHQEMGIRKKILGVDLTFHTGVYTKVIVRSCLSPTLKARVALTLMYGTAKRFEAWQNSFIFNWYTDSGFSAEDLVSDLIGFYRVFGTGPDPLLLAKPLSYTKALQIWDTYGAPGNFKNTEFTPFLFTTHPPFKKNQLIKKKLPEWLNYIKPLDESFSTLLYNQYNNRPVTNYYKDKNRINHELYSSLSSSGAIKFSESPFERPLFLFLNPHYPHRS